MSSEEVAFLTALKANPADDVARLVYADWLDDHDEPIKAEYLRFVAAIAQQDNCPSTSQEAMQLVRLAENTPAEWREQAGSRFALLLVSWTDKVQAIKWIRIVTGDGLIQAKEASENLPHPICDSVPFEVAARVFGKNKDVQGLGLRITPIPVNLPPSCFLCNVLIRPAVFGGSDSANAAHTFLVELLTTAIGISAEEANKRVNVSSDIVVATGLALHEARRLSAKLRQLIPRYEHSQGYYLNVTWQRVAVPNKS